MAAIALILLLAAAPLTAEQFPADEKDIGRAVAVARELIGSHAPPAEYRVTVTAADDETWVDFSAPVRFVPWMSEACYDVAVALEAELLYFESLRSPDEYRSECVVTPFYTPSTEDARKIEFVAGALSTRWGFDFRDEAPDGRLTIYEREHDFRVELVSDLQESWYHIGKESGRILGEGHAELVPDEILHVE